MSEALISVKHLSKSFGDLEVLKDINVDVHQGEVVCIIGPSGSGKSTFLRCINQLEKPTSGDIYYESKDMCEVKADVRKFREEVGMVFQRFNLFPLRTVLGNITMAPELTKHKNKQEATKYGIELLKKVGLESKANVMPNTLSGGQQQRVAIARRLAELLGVEYYDRDIVEKAAKQMDMPISIISDEEEKSSGFFEMVFPLGTESPERRQ